MKATHAIYLGRMVSKNNFRAFIYGADGTKRFVKSWAEFETAMQSGIWFATVKDAKECLAEQNAIESQICKEACESEPFIKPKSKGKAKAKSKPKPVAVEEVEEEIPQDDLEDGMVYEVKDDQF
jgi:hypothetical protein